MFWPVSFPPSNSFSLSLSSFPLCHYVYFCTPWKVPISSIVRCDKELYSRDKTNPSSCYYADEEGIFEKVSEAVPPDTFSGGRGTNPDEFAKGFPGLPREEVCVSSGFMSLLGEIAVG